jgi:hypothetical protein
MQRAFPTLDPILIQRIPGVFGFELRFSRKNKWKTWDHLSEWYAQTPMPDLRGANNTLVMCVVLREVVTACY